MRAGDRVVVTRFTVRGRKRADGRLPVTSLGVVRKSNGSTVCVDIGTAVLWVDAKKLTAQPTPGSGMTDDRLSYLLDTWREWMRAPDHRAHLGYPSTAAGIRWRPGDDFDDMVESLDQRMALAVDACVDSLPIMERTAVHATVLGPMVWRLREPVAVVYARAREVLKLGLSMRGIE